MDQPHRLARPPRGSERCAPLIRALNHALHGQSLLQEGPAALRVGFLSTLALGAAFAGGDGREDRFAQLRAELPTPNSYRTASGAPGHEYWQQQVDYVIDVALDDENQRISGTERITYHNNSPDTLRYLWLLVEPNLFSPEAHAVATSLAPNLASGVTFRTMRSMMERQRFDGGADRLERHRSVRDTARAHRGQHHDADRPAGARWRAARPSSSASTGSTRSTIRS